MSPRGDGAGPDAGPSAPFAGRNTYRRRRLTDIAKLLPVLGAALLAVPLMWPDPDPYPAPGSAAGMPMSAAITYILVVWAGLILANFAFGIAVQRWAGHWTRGDARAGGEEEGSSGGEAG
ncbi:hypothetical protein ACUXV3_02640 [Roseobacteraceae bacterium NS-SX3]